MVDFHSALHEVSKLNSWTRAKGWAVPKYAIYWLKSEAIKRAISLDLCNHKKVFVLARCRDCGGMGKYTDSAGYTHDHCRACENKGIVALRFVETTIKVDGLEITWHSPWLKASFNHGLGSEGPWSMPKDGWYVNQLGQDLSPVDAAKALNIAEIFFNAGPGRCTWIPSWDDFPYASVDNFDYKLHLGQKPRTCSLCGESRKEEIPHGYGASKGRLQWTDFACKSCDQKNGGDASIHIWDLFEPPEIVNDPQIRTWEARHVAWFPKK